MESLVVFFLLLTVANAWRDTSFSLEDEFSEIIKQSIKNDIYAHRKAALRRTQYSDNKKALHKLLSYLNDYLSADVTETFRRKEQDNFQMCSGVGVECSHCSDCFPGGWCIHSSPYSPKCLCNYGWTGPHGLYLPNTNDRAWGINRIVADNCRTSCHYTHDFRNKTCAGIEPTRKPTGTRKPTRKPTGTFKRPPPSCHPLCGKFKGTCDFTIKRCKCLHNWAGPNKKYYRTKNTYYADYCDKPCPYLGWQIPNPACTDDGNKISKDEISLDEIQSM